LVKKLFIAFQACIAEGVLVVYSGDLKKYLGEWRGSLVKEVVH
jgi:hypothetical protein